MQQNTRIDLNIRSSRQDKDNSAFAFVLEITEGAVCIYCTRAQLITTEKTQRGDKWSNEVRLAMIQPCKYLIRNNPAMQPVKITKISCYNLIVLQVNNCSLLLALSSVLLFLHWAISYIYLYLRNGVSGMTKSFITSQKQPGWIIESRCSWFKLDTRVHFLSVLCKTTYYTSQAAAGSTGPAWISTLLRCQCNNHTTHMNAGLHFFFSR